MSDFAEVHSSRMGLAEHPTQNSPATTVETPDPGVSTAPCKPTQQPPCRDRLRPVLTGLKYFLVPRQATPSKQPHPPPPESRIG